MSVLLHEPGRSSRDCGHGSLDLLGSEEKATFYRWAECGSVVIVAGENRWVLRSTMLP